MLKESKIRVLENFYALDYIFFGKPVSEVEMCCPLVKEEYLSVKGALMSVFVEMLKILDHNPRALEESVNGDALHTMAKQSAQIARENSQKIVTSQKARDNIKSSLQEALKENPKVDVGRIVEKTIRQKAFGLAVDSLLVARSISEADQPERMNEWEGRIVEDSYKILRDNLIESAHQILYDVTDDAPAAEADFTPATWVEAIQLDVDTMIVEGVLDEADAGSMTDAEKTYNFGYIQRLFGECAKKCGRIALGGEKKRCKQECIHKRDAAIHKARAQVSALRAKQHAKKKK